MVDVTIASGLKLSFNDEIKDITVETSAIIPRLRLDVSAQYITELGQPAYTLSLSFSPSKLSVISKTGTEFYVTTLMPEWLRYSLTPASSFSSYFYADLDHYRLAQIEKIREGGDLQLRATLDFIAEVERQPPVKYFAAVAVKKRVPKSDWVERILPQLKYKDVSLIEIPKIERPDFTDIMSRVNEAWRQHLMGEYDKVLTECRKAMEGLTTFIKNMGFQKEVVDEKGVRKAIPDWEKALAHKEMGDIIETMVQKHFGFLSPGAHYGKSINREDAEFAIMFTHGLINLVSKKLTLQPNH
ncbi:MAG: hypothetical protein QXP38_13340 [Nitrososphaerota archaeon]